MADNICTCWPKSSSRAKLTTDSQEERLQKQLKKKHFKNLLGNLRESVRNQLKKMFKIENGYQSLTFHGGQTWHSSESDLTQKCHWSGWNTSWSTEYKEIWRFFFRLCNTAKLLLKIRQKFTSSTSQERERERERERENQRNPWKWLFPIRHWYWSQILLIFPENLISFTNYDRCSFSNVSFILFLLLFITKFNAFQILRSLSNEYLVSNRILVKQMKMLFFSFCLWLYEFRTI